MYKFLFLDYRYFEHVRGFSRQMIQPTDHGPVMEAASGWEQQTLGLYGTVLRRPDGLFQMWYTAGRWGRQSKRRLGYAQSQDGIVWERPQLDVAEVDGEPTNVVFDASHVGCAVIHDQADPREDWRYKLIIAPAPMERICLYRSSDGIHWLPGAENPVIGTHPDGPIGFRRDRDGRYVLYHRPCWGDRRVGRSETWDLKNFSPTRVVLEPIPDDQTNVQFYGMGAMHYGEYEIGTLWVYRTDEQDLGWTKGLGVLEGEWVHGRGGYAWHRTAPGHPLIDRTPDPEQYGHGQYHWASSPVQLEDEIRLYYAASRCRHGEDNHERQTSGWAIGYASCKPDRFVGVSCQEDGEILTRPFWLEEAAFFVNASVQTGGSIRGEITEIAGQPIEPFTLDRCIRVTGDDWKIPLRWKDADMSVLAGREIRIRIKAENATLFAIAAGSAEEAGRYWEFDLPYHLPMHLHLQGK